MTIKTYRSETVESAIRQARLELGEEAMLLDSRKLPPEEQHLGRYEVRFGAPGGPPPEAIPGYSTASDARLAEVSRGLEDLRRLLHTFTYSYYLPSAGMGSHPVLGEVYRDLTAADVEPEIAAELVAALIPAAESGATRAEMEGELAGRMAGLVRVSDEVGRPGPGPRVAALVGPPGAGKTTTMAKLAVQYGLSRRLATCLVSADYYRVAAAEQLQTLASILGVEVRAVDTTEQLSQTLAGFRRGGPDLVLIDTPGHGLRELDPYAEELAPFLHSRDDIDVHLVLSASTKARDLHRIVERYCAFGPRKLLFTKLDETLSAGALLTQAVRTHLPLSFLATGQRIPEDLQTATPEGVAGLILNRRRMAAGR